MKMNCLSYFCYWMRNYSSLKKMNYSENCLMNLNWSLTNSKIKMNYSMTSYWRNCYCFCYLNCLTKNSNWMKMIRNYLNCCLSLMNYWNSETTSLMSYSTTMKKKICYCLKKNYWNYFLIVKTNSSYLSLNCLMNCYLKNWKKNSKMTVNLSYSSLNLNLSYYWIMNSMKMTNYLSLMSYLKIQNYLMNSKMMTYYLKKSLSLNYSTNLNCCLNCLSLNYLSCSDCCSNYYWNWMKIMNWNLNYWNWMKNWKIETNYLSLKMTNLN